MTLRAVAGASFGPQGVAGGGRPVDKLYCMNRDRVLANLAAHQAELSRYAVRSLRLFGSGARGEERGDSDIDLLVEFERPVGLFTFLRLQEYLEQLLGRRVDLVTPDTLRSEMRAAIEQEAVTAA